RCDKREEIPSFKKLIRKYCCANEMDPAFFPHEPETRQDGVVRAHNIHSSAGRREGLLCTSRHWGLMWRRTCFSCTGWIREGARCSVDASSASSCYRPWRVCRPV